MSTEIRRRENEDIDSRIEGRQSADAVILEGDDSPIIVTVILRYSDKGHRKVTFFRRIERKGVPLNRSYVTLDEASRFATAE